MEREANYAAVGAFVLLVIAMGIAFVYWYSDSRDGRNFTRYEVYFEGSVSGLERGAPVRYMGVEVGRVVEMRVDPRDAGRVQVIVDVDQTAPVSDNTIAELSLQGITGLLYIDLLANTGMRPLSAPVPSEKYPVIRSTRSNFDLFLASLPELVRVIGGVAERASLLLSDENIASISRTLSNIEQTSQDLPGTMRELRTLIVDLQTTANEISVAAKSARAVTDSAGPEIVVVMQRVRETAEHLAKATERLDQLVEENRRDLRGFTRDGLPELERLLRDGRQAAREIRDLSRALRDNPSQLLYRPSQQGVEIPR
jgi:phospholipid/cholesterol/gamma-HCH transport system substrate-binding protein